MATFLPGVKGRMGRWTYYVVRMRMQDLRYIKFASEIEEGNALSSTLQRAVQKSRARGAMADYLIKQPDRFFNSLVIAALGGNATWMPIQIEDDPRLAILAGDEAFRDSFGVLRMDGSENYYALDGQHRLAAIGSLLDPSSDLYPLAPPGFSNEQVSVVLVIPGEAETQEVFMQRYRRLFSNLNRYAKPMDKATSIIVDEDDAIAIVTRELFRRHEFFKSVGPDKESLVVDCSPGKNISNPAAPHLTKLEIFYDVNATLLNSNSRNQEGWFESGLDFTEFIRFRPTDEEIDVLYNEISNCWTVLLEVLPELRNEAGKMRVHAALDSDEDMDVRDCALFWPIGQEVLARVAKSLLDRTSGARTDLQATRAALAPISTMPWDLTSRFLRGLLVVQDPATGKWKMRNESRKEAVKVAISVALAMVDTAVTADDLENLRETWQGTVLPPLSEEESIPAWKEVLASFGRE